MSKRSIIAATVAVVLVAGGGTGAYVATQRGNGAAAASTPQAPAATATVTRTDLTTTESVNGTLGYTGSHDISSQAHGTLTALAAEGTTVTRGQTLYELDGSPIVLMYGDKPAWRTIGAGVSDGPDVKQLDDNLIALGYATSANLTPSNHFSDADAAAVKRWQKALGVDQTGIVQFGAVVFLPGPIRVATHRVEVGASVNPGMVISAATDTTRAVTVALDVAKQALVKVGDAVSIDLPSGASVTGKVSAIASVAKAPSNNNGGGGGSSTIDVTITIDDQSKLGALDQAPVDVVIITQSAKGVLTVPITALTALTNGGYAVDVIENGTRHRVPVTTGLFSKTLVEVTGDGLSEGQAVEVPSS
ncbi:MAG TPA: peptidoglycan-binding protein [Candidatus Dormibacteraeota bacterium]|jgi:peptidoglycan hydrolase-like protein with peptidoglycan-binding domain|nr:peptidoglycan-binding protein [Candidatus Dormibacteraeota bacterium]